MLSPFPQLHLEDGTSEAIEQAMIGWSPTVEASAWSLVLGEPPPSSMLPPEESGLPSRETLTLIDWSFGQPLKPPPVDPVDEALVESFPASDPPAWMP